LELSEYGGYLAVHSHKQKKRALKAPPVFSFIFAVLEGGGVSVDMLSLVFSSTQTHTHTHLYKPLGQRCTAVKRKKKTLAGVMFCVRLPHKGVILLLLVLCDS
jgi:hypothetical protein